MVWAACAALLLVLWGAIAVFGIERVHTRERERSAEVVSTAKGFSEYVGLHLLFVDRVLQNARDLYARTGVVPRHAVLAGDMGSVSALLLQIAVADAQGNVVASSLPLNPGVSIADRPHFLAFRNDARDRLHVSEPVVGRVSGKMSLQLVRPVLGPAGEFRGVIVASIDPQKLQHYFASLDAFAAGGRVLIAGRDDGIVRAQFEHDQISWGLSVRASAHWDQLANDVRGSYKAKASSIDGSHRLVGFHKVADYPLVVIVSTLVPLLSPYELGLGVAFGLALTLVLLTFVRGRLRHGRDQALLIEHLRQSRAREAEANRMKSNFIALVSHELRTPLHAILGFSELLRDYPNERDNALHADLIHSSGQHLLALLNTLLDLAKIEAGRMEVQRADVDLCATLHSVVQAHRASATAKALALALECQLPPQQTAFAMTDATKYVQVLNNVLSNAVKFTAQGQIRVAAYLEAKDFVVEVSDTGCGVPAQDLPHVFDRFSRASRPGSHREAGTGLGLSLSRELIELLGGSIHLTSVAGTGTRVFIRLPGSHLREAS